jgi:hypothetical protein
MRSRVLQGHNFCVSEWITVSFSHIEPATYYLELGINNHRADRHVTVECSTGSQSKRFTHGRLILRSIHRSIVG